MGEGGKEFESTVRTTGKSLQEATSISAPIPLHLPPEEGGNIVSSVKATHQPVSMSPMCISCKYCVVGSDPKEGTRFCDMGHLALKRLVIVAWRPTHR